MEESYNAYGMKTVKFSSPEEMDAWVRKNCSPNAIAQYNKAPGYIDKETGIKCFKGREPSSQAKAV